MNTAMLRNAALGAIAIGFAVGPDTGTAQATSDPLFDSGATTGLNAVAAGDIEPVPSEITITGDENEAFADEAIALDGEYVIAAGGSRQSAVLGAITFDPTGIVVSGTLSIISAAAPSSAPTATPPADGEDFAPVTPAPAASATVTDCTATGGTYTLSASGAGEAQLELDCGGSGSTATWRLFVTGTDGFSQAQQVRAVQTDPIGTGGDTGIIDLLLTLR